MPLPTRLFGTIALAAIVLMVLLAYANHRFNADRQSLPVLVAFGLLFAAMVYSIVPLFVALFIHLQAGVGNADTAPISWLRSHPMTAVYAFWTIFTLGGLIAIPAMLSDAGYELKMPLGKSKGTLVANIGQSLDELHRASSLKVVEGSYYAYTGTRKLMSDVVFDFEIAGTGTRFPRCRYYWIETSGKDPTRIDDINIGISTEKMKRPGLEEANRRLSQQLDHDGWASGQFYYRTEDLQTLHGGATSSGRGWYWLKGDTILHLEVSRVDEEQPGEDRATAGEWIQTLHLSPRDEPIFKDLEFDKPR